MMLLKSFFEKVREYEIEYREEDWLKLEKRLDHLLAKHKQNNYNQNG